MRDTENLSTQLFKANVTPKETSTLVGSVNQKEGVFHNPLDGDSETAWYRVLRRPQWTWQGIDPIEMDEVLARIAASKQVRSHAALLDTVVGFRSGNWSYEWTQCGMSHQKKARAIETLEGTNAFSKECLLASTCFSIAGYPHLKGDTLSSQAQLLSNKAFQAAIEKTPFKVKRIETRLDGKTLEGFLYLPHTHTPLPTVIVSGSLDSVQTDLWRLFETYFAKANMAMLTLDMPSVGRSTHWALSSDTSRLHQAILNELISVPWVDHHRIGCLGFRLGANAAVRLSFLEQKKIKSCVSVGGALHGMFTDKRILECIPSMYLDTLASRMGRTRMSQTLLTQLQVLSLKNQGLLGGRRTQVPILALRLDNDPVCPSSDNQLAAHYSQGGLAKEIPRNPLHDAYHRIMLETLDWFQKTL